MRPPAPGRYRRTLLERLGIQRMGPALRMIVRNMERRPLRTALSIAGVAAAVAIVDHGQLLPRRDRGHRRHAVQPRRCAATSSVWTDRRRSTTARAASWRGCPACSRSSRPAFVPVTLRQRPPQRAQPDPRLRGAARAVPRDRRRRPRDPARGPRPGADRPAGRQARRCASATRCRSRCCEGRARSAASCAVERDRARDDGPERLHGARRAEPRCSATATCPPASCCAVERGSEAARAGGDARPCRASPGAFSKATMLRNMQEISARNVRIMSTILTAVRRA